MCWYVDWKSKDKEPIKVKLPTVPVMKLLLTVNCHINNITPPSKRYYRHQQHFAWPKKWSETARCTFTLKV